MQCLLQGIKQGECTANAQEAQAPLLQQRGLLPENPPRWHSGWDEGQERPAQ